MAAKRSRDLRRQKEIEVTEKFKKLEKENTLLKEKYADNASKLLRLKINSRTSKVLTCDIINRKK